MIDDTDAELLHRIAVIGFRVKMLAAAIAVVGIIVIAEFFMR